VASAARSTAAIVARRESFSKQPFRVVGSSHNRAEGRPGAMQFGSGFKTKPVH
jgi:hypothetical protein